MIKAQGDIIDVIGVNGDFCRISPPGLSWGPVLAPASSGLYDMPIQTNWGSYGFGQFFQSWKPKRRNIVWTVDIMNPDSHQLITQDADMWHTIYSRWKAMFSPQYEATIAYTSVDGTRTLGVRTVDTPKPFSAHNFEGKDPHLFKFGSVVQTMGCELPFYVGETKSFAYESQNLGNQWFQFPYYNPTPIDLWPVWHLTGGTTTGGITYQLPDFSYGNELNGRGIADEGKTIPLSPLQLGEDLDIQTRPDLETFITSLETNYAGRMAGRDFEYPIPPGMGDPVDGCVIRVNNPDPDGFRVQLDLTFWYDEPFSTSRVPAL